MRHDYGIAFPIHSVHIHFFFLYLLTRPKRDADIPRQHLWYQCSHSSQLTQSPSSEFLHLAQSVFGSKGLAGFADGVALLTTHVEATEEEVTEEEAADEEAADEEATEEEVTEEDALPTGCLVCDGSNTCVR